MTDSDYTAICLVVDRSGSIGLVLEDMQGAIQAFLDEQRKAPGRRTIRIAHFDTRYEVVHPSLPAAEVPAFTIIPRGGTALWDAFGRGLSEFGEELAALPEEQRPGTVIFGLVTDGLENSSKEWTAEQVKALVTQQREQYNWQILYLGANQDALVVGAKLGVAVGSSLTYSASSAGVRGMAASLSSYVARASAAPAGQAEPFSFSEEERAAASS